MKPRDLEISKEALREFATPSRINRVWQRIEGDLPRSAPRKHAAFWWAPAAAAIVFGAGVFVGRAWPPTPAAETTVGPEPFTATEPAAAPELSTPATADAAPTPTPPHVRRRQPLRSPIAVPVSENPSASEPAEPTPDEAAPVQREWSRLAALGDYDAAWTSLESQGGFDSALGSASPEELMLLHDLAKVRGQRARAVQALRSVVERHPSDPNAPLAAYTLGTMLEKAGDHAGAARALALYRRLAPQGELAEDVLVRQIDAALEQADLALACQLAAQYASDFPNGDGLDKHREALRGCSVVPAADGDAAAPAATATSAAPAAGPAPQAPARTVEH